MRFESYNHAIPTRHSGQHAATTEPLQLNAPLSKTYIYGVLEDGSCLARGRLSQATLTEMFKVSRKHQHKAVVVPDDAASRARGGFELLVQTGGDCSMFPGMMPKIITAWCEWFAYQRSFRHVKRLVTDHGLHLVIIGSHSGGKTRMRPAMTMHTEMLTEEDLKAFVQVATV